MMCMIRSPLHGVVDLSGQIMSIFPEVVRMMHYSSLWPGGRRTICVVQLMLFPGLDLYHADTAQPLPMAGGEELDDLDHDLVRN